MVASTARATGPLTLLRRLDIRSSITARRPDTTGASLATQGLSIDGVVLANAVMTRGDCPSRPGRASRVRPRSHLAGVVPVFCATGRGVRYRASGNEHSRDHRQDGRTVTACRRHRRGPSVYRATSRRASSARVNRASPSLSHHSGSASVCQRRNHPTYTVTPAPVPGCGVPVQPGQRHTQQLRRRRCQHPPGRGQQVRSDPIAVGFGGMLPADRPDPVTGHPDHHGQLLDRGTRGPVAVQQLSYRSPIPEPASIAHRVHQPDPVPVR